MALRFRFTCPLCGMMSDLKKLDEPQSFRIVEQELGGRVAGTGDKTKYSQLKNPKERGAVGVMKYTEISGSRVFASSDVDPRNPYVQQGLLGVGDDVVATIKGLLMGRLRDRKSVV